MHHSYRQSFNIQTGRRCKIILANEKLITWQITANDKFRHDSVFCSTDMEPSLARRVVLGRYLSALQCVSSI